MLNRIGWNVIGTLGTIRKPVIKTVATVSRWSDTGVSRVELRHGLFTWLDKAIRCPEAILLKVLNGPNRFGAADAIFNKLWIGTSLIWGNTVQEKLHHRDILRLVGTTNSNGPKNVINRTHYSWTLFSYCICRMPLELVNSKWVASWLRHRLFLFGLI